MAHPYDEPLQRFIALADKTFEPPTNIVKAGWKIPLGNYVFSRASYQFSSYEKFAYQFAMLLAGIGAIDRPTAEQIIASATYADGKCDISGVSFEDHAAAYGLLKQGNEYYTPKKLTAYASLISQKIAEYQIPGQPRVLRAWLARHVTPPKAYEAPSALFSERQTPYGLPLGVHPTTGNTLNYVGEASLITLAPSGKGKTQCHVLPTLMSYKGPALVLDIKGECYEHTAEWRRRNVGPVIRFNPVEPDGNARYNPLQLIDDDPDEIWESSRFLAELLVVTRSLHDPSWESQGRDLLTLILAYVVSVEEPEDRTMNKVLDLAGTIGLREMLKGVQEEPDEFPSAMRRVAARFEDMLKAPKQFQGVLSGFTQHLQLWEGPKLERATKTCDWHPDDFRRSPSPTLYLCIPPNALETYAPVMRVIIGQHVRRLMKAHDKGAAPILFLLDELPRLGRMEPIREALEVGRSYGIKLWMFAQYAEQLLQAYPDVGAGMMESCDVRMYMNPNAGTADKLARAFGKADNVLDNSRKDLLEATDAIGPKHRDSIFTLAANETPLILRKKFFHEGVRTGQT